MKITRDYLLILLAVTTLALTLTAVAAEDVPEPVQPEIEGELDPAIVAAPEVQLMGTCLTCVGNYNTGQVWEMGADCAAATTAAENTARAAADADCQSRGAFPIFACNFTFFLDACHDKMGGKVADGHATYGCWQGDFFCPEE
ncbi:MAG: hypothetical protein MI919_24920 [Holophagales bacterium]|nr:hypothetical protein [Holophagales bacterium]